VKDAVMDRIWADTPQNLKRFQSNSFFPLLAKKNLGHIFPPTKQGQHYLKHQIITDATMEHTPF